MNRQVAQCAGIGMGFQIKFLQLRLKATFWFFDAINGHKSEVNSFRFRQVCILLKLNARNHDFPGHNLYP